MPRAWWLSLALALCLVVGAEGVARLLMAPLGDRVWAYWDSDAVDKFEWYRSVAASGSPPAIVAVGDSTGARDFDPGAFSGVVGVDSYNLAWPANFPLALPVTTFPLFEDVATPDVVFLFQIPASFIDDPRAIRFEQSIRDSVIGRRELGVTSSWLDSLYLARLYPARFILLRHWIDGEALFGPPVRQGHMPLEGQEAASLRWVASDGTSPPRDFSEARRETLRTFVRLSKDRRFRIIVVVPPVAGTDDAHIVARHVRWLRTMADDESFEVWDYSGAEGLGPEHFWNGNHLNALGASVFSKQLANRYLDIQDPDTEP